MNSDLTRFLKYLQFKGECAAYQEANPVRLDYDRVIRNIQELEVMQEEKVEQLKTTMPKNPVKKWVNRPKITHKKDGTLSVHGERWFKTLRENKMPPTHKEKFQVVTGYEVANPGSPEQVKVWLFGLGWKPCTFDYKKGDDGNERKIPQVRKEGELAPSVERLIDKNPGVEVLNGLTVIQHRLSVFKGFRDCAIERKGKYYLKAEIAGLTNTLRFKHKKPLVNLPGVDKPWGEEIRGCLIAEEGETFMGCDMSSLEDTTKRHYMYPLDPDYVEEMSKEGFDPHLDLAKFAGVVTEEDIEKHNSGEISLKAIRQKFKQSNYACIYGIGAPKLSRATGMNVKEAGQLITAYWERNWAVKKVSSQQYTKEVGGFTWVKNPVSGFYYELRYDRDTWSTINQGTGVYIFDSWLARCAKRGYMGQMSFHDETGASVKDTSQTREVMFQALESLNKDLKLHVCFGIEAKTGKNYAETH